MARTILPEANALGLERYLTFYRKYGKGPTVKLRFSKSGNEKIEEAYATHYLDKERILELKKK